MVYSYSYAHTRVRNKRGVPKECKFCGLRDEKARYEWASKTKDHDNIDDFIRLCLPCHRRYDGIKIKFAEGKKITEERRKYLKDWRDRNIEKVREKDRIKARKWRKDNPERARIADKIKRDRYKKQKEEYAKEYYQRNKPSTDILNKLD